MINNKFTRQICQFQNRQIFLMSASNRYCFKSTTLSNKVCQATSWDVPAETWITITSAGRICADAATERGSQILLVKDLSASVLSVFVLVVDIDRLISRRYPTPIVGLLLSTFVSHLNFNW